MTLIISICRLASLHTLSCLKVGGIKINVEKKVDIEFDNEMVVGKEIMVLGGNNPSTCCKFHIFSYAINVPYVFDYYLYREFTD